MPWVIRIDPTTGRTLAVNPASYDCLWDTPPELMLPGYEQHFNQETGQWYYVNTKTNTTSFEAPLINTDGPSFVKASNTAGGGGHSGSGGMIGASRGDGVAGGASLPSGSGGSAGSHSSGGGEYKTDVNLKKGDFFAMLPAVPSPTLPPEKISANSKVKNNLFQLEGFAKQAYSNPKKPLTQSQLKAILKFSKEKYSTPLIFALKDSFSKQASLIQKHVGTYIDGKKFQPVDKITEILTVVHPFSELRDELYAHLCKQTCYNPRPAVLHKGLELLAVICAIYPPSGILEPYVVSYLREHLKDHKEKEAQYAACCLRRLKNTSLMGAMKSLPSSQDLEKLIATTLDSYFFESTIEQVMQKQKNEFPDLNVPVILPYMTSLIVQLGGFRTEGIFRIPGDVDLVHYMKMQVESGQFGNFETKDPRTPASLLSLWLRELKEPLIPDNRYDDALAAAGDAAACVNVIESLTEYHRASIQFLVRFLQSLTAEENQQHTKMGIANVAMVFAPNFLRCTSSNPQMKGVAKAISFFTRTNLSQPLYN